MINPAFKELMQHTGFVVDRLSSEIVYRTQKKDTWEQALLAAEKACKKRFRGDRYKIEISERKPSYVVHGPQGETVSFYQRTNKGEK